MIRYLFLAASLLFLSIGDGQAQNNTFKQELSVGASFGMNFSSIFLAPKVNQKMKNQN